MSRWPVGNDPNHWKRSELSRKSGRHLRGYARSNVHVCTYVAGPIGANVKLLRTTSLCCSKSSTESDTRIEYFSAAEVDVAQHRVSIECDQMQGRK